MPDWRITVDRQRCIGAGLCAATAPGHFRVAGGRSVPVVDLVAPAAEVAEAAELCPMEAITVRDAATGAEVASPGGVAW